MLLKQLEKGLEAGTDEAGRGSLAGPVVAAAVILPHNFNEPMLKDSKKTTNKQRNILRKIIEKKALAFSISSCSVKEIDQLNRVERDIYLSAAETGNYQEPDILPDIELPDLVLAFHEVLKKAEMFSTLHFTKEPLSVKERMSEILDKITGNDFVKFEDLFDLDEQRIGLVVTFLAILELMKELLIEVIQAQDFGIIHVKMLVDKETHD